jgi:hypothetical protein
MYAGVPGSGPRAAVAVVASSAAVVAEIDASAVAMPKSRILIEPSGVTARWRV